MSSINPIIKLKTLAFHIRDTYKKPAAQFFKSETSKVDLLSRLKKAIEDLPQDLHAAYPQEISSMSNSLTAIKKLSCWEIKGIAENLSSIADAANGIYLAKIRPSGTDAPAHPPSPAEDESVKDLHVEGIALDLMESHPLTVLGLKEALAEVKKGAYGKKTQEALEDSSIYELSLIFKLLLCDQYRKPREERCEIFSIGSSHHIRMQLDLEEEYQNKEEDLEKDFISQDAFDAWQADYCESQHKRALKWEGEIDRYKRDFSAKTASLADQTPAFYENMIYESEEFNQIVATMATEFGQDRFYALTNAVRALSPPSPRFLNETLLRIESRAKEGGHSRALQIARLLPPYSEMNDRDAIAMRMFIQDKLIVPLLQSGSIFDAILYFEKMVVERGDFRFAQWSYVVHDWNSLAKVLMRAYLDKHKILPYTFIHKLFPLSNPATEKQREEASEGLNMIIVNLISSGDKKLAMELFCSYIPKEAAFWTSAHAKASKTWLMTAETFIQRYSKDNDEAFLLEVIEKMPSFKQMDPELAEDFYSLFNWANLCATNCKHQCAQKIASKIPSPPANFLIQGLLTQIITGDLDASVKIAQKYALREKIPDWFFPLVNICVARGRTDLGKLLMDKASHHFRDRDTLISATCSRILRNFPTDSEEFHLFIAENSLPSNQDSTLVIYPLSPTIFFSIDLNRPAVAAALAEHAYRIGQGKDLLQSCIQFCMGKRDFATAIFMMKGYFRFLNRAPLPGECADLFLSNNNFNLKN